MAIKNSLSYFFLKKLILSDRSSSLIRRISILSFFVISLSLSAFFVVLFVMNGMNQNIKSRIMAIEPHLSTINDFTKDGTVNEYVMDVKSKIKYQKFDLIIRTIDGQFRGAEAVGYDGQGLNNWMQMLHNVKKSRNRYYYSESETDTLDFAENEVAIGADLARALGVLEGDEITLIPPETLLMSSLETPLFQKVTVKKILVTDLSDIDSRLLLFNSDNTLKRFSNTLSRKTGFHIWLNNISQVDRYKSALATVGVESETWNEKNSDLFFALKLEKLMIGTFLGLAGLIASTSILTVLALLMSQKKHDIAVLKTLGLSQRNTLFLFTKIGLWISGGAIALGSLIGVGASLYIQHNPVNILPNIYYDSSIPAYVEPGFAVVVVLVSGVLAFLGSYIPAKITLGIQPAILLRHRN